jgi:uncharacterized protein (DUF305 family)
VKGILRREARGPREESPPKRRGLLSRFPALTTALVAGAVVVGAAAGAAVASLFFVDRSGGEATEQTAIVPPSEDSADAGFTRDMMVHHAQAVQMAETVRGSTEREEIRTLAADIALSQQGQIGQMQGWLAVWGLSPTSSEPAMTWMGHPTEGRMPGMASPEDLDNLQKAPPDEADVLFLQLMIPHHQAALQMTEAILNRTDRPEVETLAKAISASQQSEIQNMEQMLQDRGASQPEEPEMHMEHM